METKAFNEQSLQIENAALRARLEEAEELLRALRAGEVEAIMLEADAIREITKRKAAEEALRENEARLNGILRRSPAGILQTDSEGRMTLVNHRWCEMLGYSEAELLGKNVFDITHPASVQPTIEAVARLSAGGPDFEIEKTYCRKNGSLLNAQSNVTAMRSPDGKFLGMIAVVLDITERIRIALELRDKTDFLRRITEITPGVLHVFDIEERRSVFINQSLEALLGFEPETVRAMGVDVISTLMHPDDLPLFEQHLDRVRSLSDGEVVHFEHRLRDQVGQWHWFRSCDTVFARGDLGAVRQLIGVATEITDRKRAETELREREHFLERIFEVMPGILKIVDMNDNRCVFVNSNIVSVLGYSPDEILQMGADILQILMHPDDQTHYYHHFSRIATFEPGMIAKFEYRMRHKDGEWRWLETRDTVFLRDDNGVANQYIGLSSEITDRKRAEEELQRLAAELSNADQRKDEFLATLAHELRNPLAPIRNGLQILRLSNDDKEKVEEIHTMMERQLAQMVHLVDDLLDVSRISRGKLELRKQLIELSSVINNAVETSRPLIEASGHQLTVILPLEPIFVDADATRLGQVFSNILNNAAKYSEPGGRIELVVSVASRLASAESEAMKLAIHQSPLATPFVVVSVKDTGVGIPPDMLPKIFEMFTQVDRSLEKAQGGLGIGLSLVKRLVEMHGGNVVAHSDGHGTGSEFVVRLPIVSSNVHENKLRIDEVQTASSSGKRRILVADDNQDAAKTLAMLLKIMGNEVHTANDGLQAVEMADVFQPQVILLDIGMPKLNGYEACRRIRERPWGKKVILIALTGWGQDDDRRRSLEAGFDHHLVKPVDPATLRKLLSAEQSAG